MGCISSAPVEPEVDEFAGDPLADLKRRKRDLENEVRGAAEYGQALLASQTELLQYIFLLAEEEGAGGKATVMLRQFLGRRLGGVVAEPRHTVRGSPERGSSLP